MDSHYAREPVSKEPFDSVVGIFGRLKPGVSMVSAETELVELHQRVVKESPAGSWVAQIAPIVRDLREQFTWLADETYELRYLFYLPRSRSSC